MFSLISIFVPSILGGLRIRGIGTDTLGYAAQSCMSAINATDFAKFNNQNSSLDIGYNLMCYFSMKIFGYENWFYFFCQLFTNTCIYIGAYKHKDKISLSFTMLIFYLMFYNESFNAIRQYLAISVIFMSIHTLEKKEYVKFALWIVFASLFHRSAFIVFGLLIMHVVVTSKTIRTSTWLRRLLFCGVFTSLMFTRSILKSIMELIPFLMTKYGAYFETKYNDMKPQTWIIIIMIGTLLMINIYRNGAMSTLAGPSEQRNNIEFYRINIIFCLFFQVMVRFFVNRVLLYSDVINVFAVAAIPRFIKEKNLRAMVTFTIIVVMLVYWWGKYILYNSSETYPYMSILLL